MHRSTLARAMRASFVAAVSAGALAGPAAAATSTSFAQLPINATTQPGFSGASAVNLGGTTLFIAQQAGHGQQLWKTDGSEAGTTLVADLQAEDTGDEVEEVVLAGGKAYMLVPVGGGNEEGRGKSRSQAELWVSDGTTAGTRKVANADAATQPTELEDLVVAGGSAYLAAQDPLSESMSIYTTDGTALTRVAGTTEAYVNSLTASADQLFYSAAAPGTETASLHVLDTATGASHEVLMHDEASGDDLPVLLDRFYAARGGLAYLRGRTSTSEPARLIVTGGTAASSSTVLLEGDPVTNYLGDVVATADGMAFADSVDETYRLVAVTGATGTVVATSPGEFESLATYGSTLVFSTNLDASGEPDVGRALYRTGAGIEGIELVADVDPRPSDNRFDGLTVSGGSLYFVAYDEHDVSQLFRTTGPGATQQLTDLSDSSSDFRQPRAIPGGVLFVGADVAHKDEPWISDGTQGGTHLLRDINTATSMSNPGAAVSLGSVAVFAADDGIHGNELWSTDGTAAGTKLLKDAATGSRGSSPRQLTKVGSKVFFIALTSNEYRLWVTDGTAEGTRLVPTTDAPDQVHNVQSLRTFGNGIAFIDRSADNYDSAWVSDGTAEGTHELSPRASGEGPDVHFGVQQLEVAGARIFLRGQVYGGPGDFELRSLTADGTVERLTDDGDYSAEMHVAGDRAYVPRFDGNNYIGWVSDGTAAGTGVIMDSTDTPVTTGFGQIATLGTGGLFSTYADDGYYRQGSDGKAVKVEIPHTGSAYSLQVVAAGGVTYAAGTADVEGASVPTLWKVGTDGAVSVVRRFPSADPDTGELWNLESSGGRLVFTAYDAAHGREVWQSDGTAEGTALLFESVPGSASKNPAFLGEVNGHLLASVYSEQQDGSDLFSFGEHPVADTPTPTPSPTPAPVAEPTAAPPAPAATPKPIAAPPAPKREELQDVSAKVASHERNTYVVSGKLVLAKGSKATCKGTVEIRVSVGGRKRATFTTKAKLKKGVCTYRKEFTLAGKVAAMPGNRTAKVKFIGNKGIESELSDRITLPRG